MREELLDTEWVMQEMKFWNVPGCAAGVMKDGRTVFTKGYGYRDVERGKPFTPDTLGCMASTTKSFTAALMGMLVDEGRVSYDEPIRNFVPDFALSDPMASEQATLRDLFYHRTGLPPHDAMWPDDTITRREYLRRLRYLKPVMPFRYAMEYSNVIYNAIGCIEEQLTGCTWEDLVRTRILQPLGMKRSCVTREEMGLDTNAAKGYFVRDLRTPPAAMEPMELNVGAPAAALCSSTKEMLLWLEMQRRDGVYLQNGKEKRLLSETVCRQMHHGGVVRGTYPWDCEELPDVSTYGMGWKTLIYRGLEIIFHSGELEGFCSASLFNQEENFSICVIVNRHKPAKPFISELVFTMIDRLMGYPDIDWAERLHPYWNRFGGAHYDWLMDISGTHGQDENKIQQFTVKNTEDAASAGETQNNSLFRGSEKTAGICGTYTDPGYGSLQVELAYGRDARIPAELHDKRQRSWKYTCENAGRRILFLDYKHWRLPLLPLDEGTAEYLVEGIKEDTIYITCRVTFHFAEAGKPAESLEIPLEPEIGPISFHRKE